MDLYELSRIYATARAERERHDTTTLCQKLSREQLFRVGFVPHVLAAVAFDYADTLCDMAAQMHLDNKKACRAIRSLCKDYAAFRSTFLDRDTEANQQANSELLQAQIGPEIRRMDRLIALEHTRVSLEKGVPFSPEKADYFSALYQMRVVLRVLFRITEKARQVAQDALLRRVGDLCPQQARDLYTLSLDMAVPFRLPETAPLRSCEDEIFRLVDTIQIDDRKVETVSVEMVSR